MTASTNHAPADDLLRLENQLCFALVTAARNVVSIYRPILEPLGLTHPQYLVMLALWERSPRTLGDLANDLALEPATVSPLVKRLESDGRVMRQRSREDERRLEIELTADGRRLSDRARAVPIQVLEKVRMTVGEVDELRNGISQFVGRTAFE